MNPGPEPKEAIREAIKNALARGTGLDRDLLLEARFQFILFCAGLTVFVLVRRTRVRITSPEDCAAEYRRDILRLRRVPLNGVVARELWLLSSWGTWQYFRILDNRVIEIRADGTPMVTVRAALPKGPAPVADSASVPVPDSVSASEPDSVPAPVPDPSSDSGTDSETALIPDPEPDPEPDSASAPITDPSSDPSPAPVPDPSSDSGTDSGLASEPAHVPAPEPDPVPAPVPARVSLPELSPLGSSPTSDEGGE